MTQAEAKQDGESRQGEAGPLAGPRALSPAARRALAEAAERRAAYEAREAAMPKELGGRRKGREPGRYGDWELKGLAVDF